MKVGLNKVDLFAGCKASVRLSPDPDAKDAMPGKRKHFYEENASNS